MKVDLIWYSHSPPQVVDCLSHRICVTKDLISYPNARINPSTIEVTLGITSHLIVPMQFQCSVLLERAGLSVLAQSLHRTLAMLL